MASARSWFDRIFPPDPSPSSPPRTSGAAPSRSDEVVDMVRITRDIRGYLAMRSRAPLSIEQVSGSQDLFDAGYVDSLSAVELLAYIEERYGIVIREHQLVGELSTVEALAGFIVEAT